MAINIPNINTNINNPEKPNREADARLRAFLQGQQGGIEGANRLLSQDEAAKLEQRAKEEDLKRALDTIASGKVSAESGLQTGTAHIMPKDELSRWLKMEQFKEAKAKHLDEQTRGLSDRLSKAQIPETTSRLNALEGSAQASGGKLKSLGGLKNLLPDFAVGAGESLGLLPQGSAQERQDYNALQNAMAHAQFGSRQTEAEMARLRAQLGQNFGNSEENMRKAFDALRQTMGSQGQNIVQGTNPEAVAEFKKRGGNVDFASASQQPAQAPIPTQQQAPAQPPVPNQPPMSFEEFKRRKAAGQL